MAGLQVLVRTGLVGCVLALGACEPELAGAPHGEPPPSMALADRLAQSGDPAQAVALYSRAAEEARGTPGEVQALLRLGDALRAAGDPQRAAGAYREALALRPNLPEALRGLGVALLGRGLAASAAVYLKAATERGDASAWSPLGVAYDMQGRSDEAQAAYEAGLRAAPSDPDLLTNMALSKALTGAYGDAVRTLRDVNASGRADRRHRHALVLVLALSGDETGARAEGRSLRIPDPEVDEVLQVARTAAAEADPRRRAALIGVAPG